MANDDEHPYSQNQDVIEAALRFICRKHHLREDLAEEFSQWTRLKLIEHDCAILRSFKGTSSLKSFLVTVVLNKYRDWLNEQFGKWRPSAEARRLGPIAIHLERMVLRDGMGYDEAVQTLISKGIASTAAECDAVWGQLKRAKRRQFVSIEHLENQEDRPSPDPMEDDEWQRLTRRVHAVFRATLAALPPGDQLIFKLRFWEGWTVAKIAKQQQIEQKPLYRRFEQQFKQLDRDMRAQGLTDQEIRDFFNGLDIFPDDFEDDGEDEGGK